MYLEANLAEARSGMLGDTSTGASAWGAIETKAKTNNYDTSKQSIDDYAAVGGAVVGGAVAGAACTPVAGPVGTYVCGGVGAIVGGIIASAAADAIQSIGAAIFGGDTYADPGDTWNPVADKAIAGIVKALRSQRGEDVSAPPGGSFRNYPEWDAVAVAWAKRVNDIVSSHGGPIKWFYDSPTDKDPGRIRGAAVNQWVKCGGTFTAMGQVTYPPDSECKNSQGESASKYLPEAVVTATQQTAVEVLVAGPKDVSTTASTVVKVGAVAGVVALAWYFRTPLITLVSGIFKK